MAEAIPAGKRHRVFDIDDGGSFDRLVEETRRVVRMRGGSEAEATDLLQCRVLEAFVGRFSKKRKGVNKKRAETEKHKSGKKAGKRICLAEEKENAPPPPKVPSELERRIKGKGGRDVQLVIQKKLTNTDLKTHQGRLLIPVKQMREDACFLTEREEDILSSAEKGSSEVRVMVMEPCGVDSEMLLVKWNMQTSKNYGLRTGWSKAIERNHEEAKHLEVDQFIQLWSFRVGSQLWFAIDTEAPSSSSSSSDSHCNVELEGQSTVEED